MRKKRSSNRWLVLVCCLILSGGLAQAAVLYTGTISLVSSDPTQLGRISRDGITADWSFQKDFPGVINPATPYHYETVSVFVPSWFPFLQISIDSNNANTFGAVYDTSYHPDALAVNYMGDAGGSGNFFGNPLFFQVVDLTAAASPSGGTVVFVLNETSTNGTGLNSPAGILIEGFSDTDFNETTPEPMTSTLLAGGILVLAARYRLRRTGS